MCDRTPNLRRLLPFVLLAVGLPWAPHAAAAQTSPTVLVDIIKQPYVGERNEPELSNNPDYIHAVGLEALIEQWGGELVRPIRAIQLREETTLSGMLGGMPLAVAAGHGLERFRIESGLETPIPMEHIVWGGVRDLDPLEADRFEEFNVQQVSVDDLANRTDNLHAQMRALSERVDVIYIHIDMDVLESDEVPGHGLRVPNGPSSQALGLAVRDMFRYPKAVALGVASTPAGSSDPRGISRRAALNLIRGAIDGVRSREH